MATLLSLRLKAASKLKLTNASNLESKRELAQADGLTKLEAMELAQWLQQSGHASIQLNHDRDNYCVKWRN